ncbi:MAG: OmpA family protein [Chitinophagaceae bacterium]|nr:OmpA family protein [Chitinophagaceae bacterium]
MKKYFIIFSIFISLNSCIPPGKLSEALDANTLLSNRYDTLKNKLNDTVANFSNSITALKSNVNSLNDSVSYYRALAAKPPVITEGEVFLNQMLGLSLLSKSELAGIKTTNGVNGGSNIWLEGFKEDMKKYTAADADVKLNKGFVFVDVSDKILFKSGSNALNKQSKNILATIAILLQAQPDLSFMIEGHTDNKAFKRKAKNDNWDLSVTRATSVARILQTKYKINPKRIIAAGRSQYVPLDDNKTKAGRLNNRRIRIVIMPTVTQVVNLNK